MNPRTLILIILAFVLAMSAAPLTVLGYGRVAVYADAAFQTTTVEDTAPGFMTVYVVAEDDPTTGARFGLELNGFTGVWLSETSSFNTVGSSSEGISISYSQPCIAPPVLVLEVLYEVFGTSPDCSSISVVPAQWDPTGLVWVWDCATELIPSEGTTLYINWAQQCVPVPVQTTTWGAVKALFRAD